jgi:hypothetical protein
MEIAEKIATGGLESQINKKCPFGKEEIAGVDEEEDEKIAKDDRKSVKEEQKNSGGVLGDNLLSASHGKEGTVGGPCPPPRVNKQPREDTFRAGIWVRVQGTKDIDTDYFSFIVAAHHLIPGEAALAPSRLKNYMTKGKSVTAISGKGEVRRKIRKHIGYNVNGAHNGVWLPGNYAIRKTSSPTDETWSKLFESHSDWCLNYVGSLSKVGKGQFHDAHTMYSEEVEALLNKIEGILSTHVCDECNDPEINPPFYIKNRLYRLSSYLRGQLKGPPGSWKRPWFTSDKWRDIVFGGNGKMKKQFYDAYHEAVGEVLSESIE